jgi:hypothetical protein
MKYISTFSNFNLISESIQYHLQNKISILNNVFRPGSDAYYVLLEESRKLFDSGINSFVEEDKQLFEETYLGLFAKYRGKIVPLDLPMENIESINESEYHGKKVKLNSPTRSSGPKKYKVYVRNPKTGKVKCINFGDVKGGLSAKVSDPKARSRFAKRHKCHLKKDRTTPGYWSCRINRYANIFGKSYPGYW